METITVMFTVLPNLVALVAANIAADARDADLNVGVQSTTGMFPGVILTGTVDDVIAVALPHRRGFARRTPVDPSTGRITGDSAKVGLAIVRAA